MSAHIRIGSIVEAPEGHCEMVAGASYYYLHCDPRRSRVLLVRLISTTPPRSDLTIMSQAKFEYGLDREAIYVHPTTPDRPPWLAQLEGVSIEMRQVEKETDYESYVDARVRLLDPLVERVDEVLGADNPLTLVNKYARAIRQNQTRFRTWFIVYILFGRNRWSLLPPFHRSGTWVRPADPNACKRGRPSKSTGKGSGHNMLPEHVQRIADSFKHRVQLGDTWTRVYGRSMREDFGAQTLTNGKKRMVLFHPNGDPLPSPNQYRNWVIKTFGIDEVQLAMLGRTRVRNKLKAPIGKFSENLSKLLQQTEADAYYTDDHPRGFIDPNEPLPKLCVVRIRCSLSGALTGIGMTCGPERSEAYRMAQFCAAVPKSYFCSLFGLSVRDDEWPCIGLSSNWITDRGAGSKHLENDIASTRQLPPSNAPRSKSSIESSNPHSKNLEGAPTYVLSDLTAVQMARREILRLVKDNKSMNVSGKMTPELIESKTLPVPLHVWDFFASRGRTAAVCIPVDDAVRIFLKKTILPLKKDGVWLGRLRFNSTELRQTGWLDRVRVGGNSTVTAYLLELCVSTIWVEAGGRLLQLQVDSPYLTDEEQYHLSLNDVQQIDKQMAILNSEAVTQRAAAQLEFASRLESQVGKKLDSGKRVSGRVKRTRQAQFEVGQLNQYAGRGAT